MNKSSVVTVSEPSYLSVKSNEYSSRSPSPNNSLKGFNLFRVISKKIGRGIQAKSKEYKSASSDEEEDSNSSTNVSTKSSDKNDHQKDISGCDCDYFYKNEGTVLKSDKSKGETEQDKIYEQKLPKKCLKFRTPCRHHRSSGSDTCSSNDDSSESNEANKKFRKSHSSSNDSSTSSSSVGSLKFSHVDVHKKLKSLTLGSKSLSCFSLSQIKGVNDNTENITKDKRIKKSPQRILRQPATHTYVRGISGLPTLKVINTRGCYNNQYSRG